MSWYAYVAYFFAGIFLANGVPHFVNGISGKKFQTPFAKPPGVGESSSVVNVVWGLFNFVVGYALVFGVGQFSCGLTIATLMVALGVIVISVYLAFRFGQLHNS